jgi:acetyl-CoA carboxylase, biotin carboxylase subunit
MDARPIRTVLVANRGEIALRIMRTCREMGIRTVAVYSDADRTSPHVIFADTAVHIGPAPSRESYLSIPKLLDAARATRADAIHPGYGFLAENSEFAEKVVDAGFLFIGPSADAIRAMGDKTEARRIVNKAHVPTVPGTDGPISTFAEAEAFAEKAGFPVLIKAAAGGGGKGMRVVHRREDLSSSLEQAQSEAGSAFADSRVYIEKYLEEPRHIEFQILADAHGTTVHLGERECSVQRRHQKIVEESPSVLLDDEMRRAMGSTAVKAAQACGYTNAGTIEFLVDKDRHFYFLEMNTRLQVEHPITEMRTGLDIVAWQIRIAEGARLPFTQEDIHFSGHAVECRICAEDPVNNFLPATGTIDLLQPALGPGMREDRGVELGGEISRFYDSLIAKLVSWAPTRAEAIAKMRRALAEYRIGGVDTNIPVCSFVLAHPEFSAGRYTTSFLGDEFRAEHLTILTPGEKKAVAALCAYLVEKKNGEGPGRSSPTPGSGIRLQPGWKHQRRRQLRGAR